jgi:peptidyl-dipeptidase Dcp
MTTATNPLLSESPLPYHLPPFADIRVEHFEPAFEALLLDHQAKLFKITHDPTPATFKNTFAAYDAAGGRLWRVRLLFHNLCSSASTPELRHVERRMAPRLASHDSAVAQDRALFARLDEVYRQREALGLNEEELRLAERIHTYFVRAGATLGPEAAARYAQIMGRLAELGALFKQNVLEDEAQFITLNALSDLNGIPPFLLDTLQAAAQERALPGYIVPLSRSIIVPFLTFSPNRQLREKIWRAWTSRGTHPERDNRPIIKEILALRLERAQLMGFASFAEYALIDRMAGTPQAVHELTTMLWKPALTAVACERQILVELARQHGEPTDIKAWDWRYLSEKVRAERFALSDAEIKPYFSLERMIEAMFDCANRLFGVTFSERQDLALYHPDVRLWEVYRGGNIIGLFLGDNFSRPGKRSGAWMSAYQMQTRNDGVRCPIVVNNNNFAKSNRGPVLLGLDDVRTLFHEFGHGLHGLLSNVTYQTVSGLSVPRDYVELPSQLFEHWAMVPEILERHARHYETDEPLPETLRQNIEYAARFNQGYETIRLTGAALIDMAVHELTELQDIDIEAFERDILARLEVPPEVDINHHLPHFQHLFTGDGYSAGYYVYQWAQVLEAEAFAVFEASGDPFNPELAERLYRNVYSAGNSRDPNRAFAEFLGRPPTPKALLKAKGWNA